MINCTPVSHSILKSIVNFNSYNQAFHSWIQNSYMLEDSLICRQTSIATLQTSPYHFKHSTGWIKCPLYESKPGIITTIHPQSNGQAERLVDSFKRALRKIRTGNASLEEALDLFLQTYRCTLNSTLDHRTPAEIMFGRTFRTVRYLLRPAPSSESNGRCIPTK